MTEENANFLYKERKLACLSPFSFVFIHVLFQPPPHTHTQIFLLGDMK